jgi:Skp family chaperone for outer membrane proteins
MIETMKKKYQDELSAVQSEFTNIQSRLEQLAAQREQLKGAIYALDQLTQAQNKKMLVPKEEVPAVQPIEEDIKEVVNGQESA